MVIELMVAGSFWKLQASTNGFKCEVGKELVTQASLGRCFQLIDDFEASLQINPKPSRIKVRLLEDGYQCWVDLSDVFGKALYKQFWRPLMLDSLQIQKKIPLVMHWINLAANCPNEYLWGGTCGPDFDCSGLVQAAFSSEGIWLPRDAYQQERFCEPISVSLEDFSLLKPGDLLFFGTPRNCNHVGIHRGGGKYWHSSGINYGHNGIACDDLHSGNKIPVACYYRKHLRGAGRVLRCHDGTTLE